MNIFRHKSKIEQQLDKTAKKIRNGIANDIEKREEEEQIRQQQLLWASLSPRLKLKLLKHAEERRRNAKR
jgi:hypothetical protein